MSSITRTISTTIMDWRGMLVRVTFERQRFADHLTVESIEPQRAPLPITETGYRSAFISKDVVEDPATYVEAWLDEAAKSRGWLTIEADVRQYALF